MVDLYEILNEKGLIYYGSHLSGDLIRHIAGIEEIKDDELKTMDVKTIRERINTQELAELNVTGALRMDLLERGMYLKKTGLDYRILLPSENADQVKSYLKSSDKKLKRATLLQANTPKQIGNKPNQEITRLQMKMQSNQEWADRISL